MTLLGVPPDRKRKKSVTFNESPILLKHGRGNKLKSSPSRSPGAKPSLDHATTLPAVPGSTSGSKAAQSSKKIKTKAPSLKQAIEATMKKKTSKASVSSLGKASSTGFQKVNVPRPRSRKNSMLPEPWGYSESFVNLGPNESAKSRWKKGLGTQGKKAKTGWDSLDLKKQLNMDIFDLARLLKGARGNMAPSLPSIQEQDTTRMNLDLYGGDQVVGVLSNVQKSQQARQQESITTELRGIHKRVKQALEDVGMTDSEGTGEEQTSHVRLPSICAANREKEKIEARSAIVDRMDHYEEKAMVKRQYLMELNFWFEDNCKLDADVLSPEEMKDRLTEYQDINSEIQALLQSFMKTGDRVVDKGRELLEETTKIIEERRQLMNKKTRKDRIIVYDDKALLIDQIKWENASKTIISVFEDSHKMIKNVMFKSALQLGRKQFDYMMVACEKRFQELSEKKKQCFDLQAKVNQAKNTAERATKEMEEQRKKMSKMTSECLESKQALENIQEKNREMHFKIVDLNSKVMFLEKEVIARTNLTPPPPPTPPEPEIMYVTKIDSATEQQLRECEAELHGSKMQLQQTQLRLNKVTEQLRFEQEKTRQLEERLSDLENVESPEMPPSTVSDVPETALVDRDSLYYKTLMSGMKIEFEAEMKRIKSHMKKEKVRSIANMKKTENLHSEQMKQVTRDTMRMLRAIVHFRDHMLKCLEKESLIDQAQALQDLGDIIKDKLSPDPREVLAVVVGTVVDYLHNLEEILSTSFLAMKVLLRSQIEKQVESELMAKFMKERKEFENKRAVKEVTKQKKTLKAASDDVSGLAKRLKKAKNNLKKTKDDIESFTPDKRYMDLLSRYNNMQRMYKTMQKEMEVLHYDFKNTMKKKMDEQETMIISKLQMEMKNQQNMSDEDFVVSVTDQKENLRLLTKAYEENKVPKETFTTVMSLILRSLEIPRERLRGLMEQYIAFRNLAETRDRLLSIIATEGDALPLDTRNEMRLYIEQLEGKFTSGVKSWRERSAELGEDRKEINKKIFRMFNEVLLETGLILAHPLIKTATNRRIMYTKAATSVPREQMKSRLHKRQKKTVQQLLGPPDELQGCSMPIQYASQKFWEKQKLRRITTAQDMRAGISPNIASPHMLAYDINKPRINAVRSFHNMHRETMTVRKTEGFHIDDLFGVQFVRRAPIPVHFSAIAPGTVSVLNG